MALDIQRESGDNLITVTVTGTLVRADYAAFVPQIEALIQRLGKLRILFIMKDFHGWDLGAAWEDVKFDIKHFSDIERLAVVGEARWELWMTNLSKPFTWAEVKYFDASQLDAARQWLRTESAHREITLNTTEQQLLINLLENEVRQVRSEDYHAESNDVKMLLKEREADIKRLLQRLQAV